MAISQVYMSNSIFPSSASNNPRNIELGRVEHICYVYLTVFSRLVEAAYFDDLFFSKFTQFSVQTCSSSMSFILLRSHPLKIFRTVIEAVRVFVVHLSKSLRIANEGESNESVDEELTRNLVFVEHNHLVAMSDKPRFEKFMLSATPYFARFVGSIKSLVSFDVFHGEIIPRVYLFGQPNYSYPVYQC